MTDRKNKKPCDVLCPLMSKSGGLVYCTPACAAFDGSSIKLESSEEEKYFWACTATDSPQRYYLI